MNRREHWNHVYQTKGIAEVSWYQRRPDVSLALIAASIVSKDAGIIDVGGGASTLIDFLLEARYGRLAVLDLSGVALTGADTLPRSGGPCSPEGRWSFPLSHTTARRSAAASK
jgi:hypothetical protein